MSDKFEITGTVHAIPPPRTTAGGKSFGSFVLLVEDGKYPQHIPFDAKDDVLAKIGEGDEVRVAFNVRGREWNDPKGGVKYFGSLAAWKVEVTKRGDVRPPPAPNGGGWGAPDSDIPFAVCSIDAEPSPIAPALRRNV